MTDSDESGSLHNPGQLYCDQGTMKEAEKMYVRALRGYEEVEGNHQAKVTHLREKMSVIKAEGDLFVSCLLETRC